MKTSIVIIGIMCFAAAESVAQNFVPPAGSTLSDGNIGSIYTGQTILFDVPSTITITEQQIIDGGDAVAIGILGSSINPGATYELNIESVTFLLSSLPAGLTGNCAGCPISSGSGAEIEISGTPTIGGIFNIDIISETTGGVLVETFNGPITIPFGGVYDNGNGSTVPVSPLSGVLDSEDYTMEILNTNNLPTISVATVASDANNCTGSAEVEVHSGTAPFNYTFSTGQSGLQPELLSLCPNVYSVSVEDANGQVANEIFVIADDSNIYTNILGLFGDTLYTSPVIICDLDFSAPIDSFEVSQVTAIGSNSLLGYWVVWQQGNSYSIVGTYPYVNSPSISLSLTIFCMNGRSELGSFQLFAEAPEITASIKEDEKPIIVNSWPNPCVDILNLDFSASQAPLEMTLVDVTGKEIWNSSSLNPSRTSGYAIDVSTWPSGVYILSGSDEKGRSFSVKVLKQ